MSIRVMSRVWDTGPEDREELLVLLALADFADDAGRCYPSMASIAAKARLSERGAQKIVRRLQDAGWLAIKTGGGRGGSNVYHIQNPEHKTPNEKRGISFPPERESTKPRTGVQETPNTGSPEPSRTIKEPSLLLSEASSDDVVTAFAEYDAMAAEAGLPRCRAISKQRVTAVRARLKEHGLGAWREALAKVAASPHCTGSNDRGWKADLDFIATPRKFLQILEGRYDARPKLAASTPQPINFDDVIREALGNA